jgi:hypothetical protein
MQAALIPMEFINQKILYLRGQKVILDFDLAQMYGVETKRLNQAVSRNQDRFPDDFMFQLSEEEFSNLRSQIATSDEQNSDNKKNMRSQIVTASQKKRNIGALPYAFTEQGIAMLSSVLRSQEAVQVNIAIMRAFVQMREAMLSHKDMAKRIDAMEAKYDGHFSQIFEALRQLFEAPKPSQTKIGYIKD